MKCSKLLFVILVVSLALIVGCTKKEKEVKLAYVEWACATASTHVVKTIIEEKLGYKCDVTPVSAAAMYQALASGDVDAMTTAWLPTTHKDYLAKVSAKVTDLGPNYEGAQIGLVVPDYVTIDTMDEINANANKFKGKIIGIDPGAGLMTKTEKALIDYKMADMELMEGTGAIMTAVLENAIKKNEWVVVTGWAPHWKFGRWNLKFLKDTKGTFGGAETINTLVRNGLDKDMPDVYKFLNNFKWTSAEIAQVMLMNKEGMDPADSAKKWVKENPAKVSAWLK